MIKSTNATSKISFFEKNCAKTNYDEELAMYGLQIYPERKRYVITGEGLQNEKIRNIVGGYAQKDGDDFVDWRNRGKLFLKQIKEAGVKPLYPQP